MLINTIEILTITTGNVELKAAADVVSIPPPTVILGILLLIETHHGSFSSIQYYGTSTL
jgi:hypothetical protein